MREVLIIGGGLAGAAAALALADRGHSCTIVEARSRLGGRAHSRVWGNSGGPVEYGGGWIRKDHDRMLALAARLGMGLVPRGPIIGQRWFRDGMACDAPAGDMAAHEAGMAQIAADAALMAEGGAEAARLAAMTVVEYLDDRALPLSARREFLAWWAISGSGAPERIGVGELLTPKIAKGMLAKLEELAFTVEGGVSTLVERAVAASGSVIVTGDAVERVVTGPDCISVTLASGRVLRADAAVVAVPVNTLAQIRFEPPLNAAQQGLRAAGHLGRALKLLIRARGVAPGLIATGETAGLRWFYSDHVLSDGATLIVGFGLFDEVGEPDAAMVHRALTAAFPEAALEGFDWHDWAHDPFARGTWVSPGLDTLPLYETTYWTGNARLAFAGSDHASAEQGWFEGALLSAEAAVDALHSYLTEEPAR